MNRPAPVPADDIIRAAANPTIAFVRSLRRRDRRAAERAFVVDGRLAVADALATGATPRLVLIREDDAGAAALPAGIRVRRVAAKLFDRLSEVDTPQGVLAVFPVPELPIRDVTTPLYLVLDRLRDPGNLGTLLRAAAGAGVDAAILTADSVDPYNPKVVRAAMGAHFRLPLRILDDAARAVIVARCPLRVVATGQAATPYDAINWRQPAALIIGSETAGVGAAGLALGTVTAAIPLAASVESLNAGVAGAVILFEAARQRRAATPPAGA
ncbi:MAG: RNA methyltransferase [Chloroflexota bacterium]|nr:RNA methyltransferase [Chloroflexota bacterium]